MISNSPEAVSNSKSRTFDEAIMARALRLAEQGRGWVSPNPVVGACLVKMGRIISEACHERYGGPHAEVATIEKAGKMTSGATLYVTLEPCSTYGKTPPCVDAIAHAGIRRVVVATLDFHPQHNGRGVSILRRLGLQVQTGVLGEQARVQNEAFFKWVRAGTPFVILKMAESLDGKIASRGGQSRWISGPQARQWVHALRACVDAILVGKNTVLQDNPRLTVRTRKRARPPWRLVLDSCGAVSPRARIFSQAGPVALACSEEAFPHVVRKFAKTRTTILPLKSKRGRLDLKELLARLGSFGITFLLVEGGGEVASSFLGEHLVDKVAWLIAPKIIGGRDAKTTVEGVGIKKLDDALLVRMQNMRMLGKDFLFEGYLN